MDLPDDASSNSIMVKQFKFIDKTQDIHGLKNAQMQINIREYQKIEDQVVDFVMKSSAKKNKINV
jgi:hypothetical protein